MRGWWPCCSHYVRCLCSCADGLLRLRTVSGGDPQVYKRVKDSVTSEKEAVICQRENPFYVNTVKAFRDRRYDYKGLTKVRLLVYRLCVC
jgi:hypothetical protein